jgi:hypothetical protein
MPLYVAAAIALFVLERASGFEIERFGPLALVDSTLVYERERLPARQLAHTALLSCAFLGVALGLSLIREGSVAEVLARRASQREKSAFVVFLAVAMMVAGTATEKQQAKPFEFTSPHVRKSARADVSIMYGWPELEPSAATLLLALERASSRFEEELGFVGRPPIRVAHQSTLPARESRQQALPDADGVLIETNLAPESLDAAEVLYTAAHASFIWTTGGRASLEPEHWFLDGFSAWWVAEQLPAERERLWLRGLVVAQHGSIVPATVAGWEQLMQTEGEAMVNGLAFTAVASLVERYGRAVVIELGRKRLVAPSRNGLWAFLRAEPLSEQVTRLTGIGWADFVTVWREDLLRKSSQGSLSHRLRALPRLEARLSIEASATGPRIVYELTGEPPIAPRDCALLHTVTKPYDVFVASEQMQREAATWPAGKAKLTGDLRGQYGSGQRVFLAVECYLPELGASRRLKALRATLP